MYFYENISSKMKIKLNILKIVLIINIPKCPMFK